MGLLLNNSPGRAGSGGAQEMIFFAVPGQTVILELRVDGPDAESGKTFEVKENGAPITFDETTLVTTGPDPETLTFHSAGGFATEGTFILTVTDTNDVERIRVKAHVVADPHAIPKPSRWDGFRNGSLECSKGLLPLIGVAALAFGTFLGCLRLYGVVQEANCNACPAPAAQAVPAGGKKPPDPCLVACFEKQLAQQK